MAKSKQIFISYDTREKDWASFLKRALESRFPKARAFVAVLDIEPGDAGVPTIFKVLKSASVVVPICSHFSKTSPWLSWEAATGWTQGSLVAPLFLGITANQFGGPLAYACQGRPFDVDGTNDVLEQIRKRIAPNTKQRRLTKKERAALELLIRTQAKGPLVLDAHGPSCFQGGVNSDGDAYNLCRLRVSNHGPTTITNVEVLIAGFPPQGAPFLPFRLQRMHSTMPGHPHPFTLDAGAEVYIDVISWQPGKDRFLLEYDSTQLPNILSPRRYDIEVVVTATNLPAVHQTFIAEVNDQQILSLRSDP